MKMWLVIRKVLWWVVSGLYRAWQLNPISLFRYRMRTMYRLDANTDLPIKPRWTERIRDLFRSDVQRKIRLLQWVRSRVNHVDVDDFIYSWQDGIALCALLESVCPGVCPRFYLLKSDLRVNNCRFGLKIAHKFLGIQRIILTPEEMAIADQDTELKIVHLVQMIRWKHQRKSNSSSMETPAVTMPGRRILSRCFARGTGLKNGMVGRRAKFNIFTDCSGVLDVLVEIRGPEGEMNSEKISSLHPEVPPYLPKDNNSLKPPSSEPRSKVIADAHGNTFIRQKSFDEETNQIIPFDYQSVGEGRFLVSYVPRNPGGHTIVIKSHDHHIQGSPFQVSVSTWTSSWDIVGKSKLVSMSMLPAIDESPSRQKQLETAVSNRFLEAGSQRSMRHRGGSPKNLTVSKRRVLKRVITRNGEEILLSDYTPSPTLSRQSSADVSDLSEEEQSKKDGSGPEGHVLILESAERLRKGNKQRRQAFKKTPIKDDIYIPFEETSNDTSESLSVRSVDSYFKTDDSTSNEDKETEVSKQSDTESALSAGIDPCMSVKEKKTSKIPFHRSFSDSFAMDMELLRIDGTEETDMECPVGRDKDSAILKVIQSGSLQKTCAYFSEKNIPKSIGSLGSNNIINRDTSSAVVIRARPTLAQIQKMSRRWQSVDTEVPPDCSTPANKGIRQFSNCPHNASGSELSSAEGCRDILNNESEDRKLLQSVGSTLTRRNWSGNDLASFRSIEGSGSPSRTMNDSQVCIVVPTVNIDKATQVSSEDIKKETGWHSGAVRIKKRRICLNRGNIKLGGQDLTDYVHNGTSEDIGSSCKPDKHRLESSPSEDAGVDQERSSHNQYNVHQWLLNIEGDRFRIPADRQSTTDTNDSGIADESTSNQHLKNRHLLASRRSYPEDVHPARVQYHKRHPPGILCSSLAGNWSECALTENMNEEWSLSDSELEYGGNMLHRTRRNEQSSRRRGMYRVSGDSESERKSRLDGALESGNGGSENRTRKGWSSEWNNMSAKCSVSFSTGLSDDTDSPYVCKPRECRGISTRSPLTSQNAVDEAFGSVSPFQSAPALGKCFPGTVIDDCYEAHEFPSDNEDSIVNLDMERDKTPLSFNDDDTGMSLNKTTKTNERLYQNDTPGHKKKSYQLTSTADTSLDVLFDTYFSPASFTTLVDLIENNPFDESDQRSERLPGDLEEEEGCLAFGAGLTFGHVGITNNFQVWVRHPSNGGVSVSIYGPKPHCVTETTTTYTGDNLYEVMYEVTHPGSYIISVKRCDENVPNSPFISKIVWND